MSDADDQLGGTGGRGARLRTRLGRAWIMRPRSTPTMARIPATSKRVPAKMAKNLDKPGLYPRQLDDIVTCSMRYHRGGRVV